MRTAWAVFTKELLETVRDRRTLLMMVVVPVLLYPALLVVAEQFAVFGLQNVESRPVRVAVSGADAPGLLDFLERQEDLEVSQVEDMRLEILRAGRIDAVLRVRAPGTDGGPHELLLVFDGSRDASNRAVRRMENAVAEWEDSLLSARLAERGLQPSFANPVELQRRSVARPEAVRGNALGRFLPLLLVMITLLGAFYPAIDLAAGEKERGTLETLLTSPAPASRIIAGKFATVAAVAVFAAGLNLASMMATLHTGLFSLADFSGAGVALGWEGTALIFAALIPLAVLFAGVFLGIAVRVHSFKEAQNALTPAYVLIVFPAMMPMIPGLEFTARLALVPVGGVALLFRDLMGGGAPLVPAVLALASTAAYAGLALVFAARSFGRPEVLFGRDDVTLDAGPDVQSWWRRVGRSTGALPSPAQALGLVALVAAIFFYGGRALRSALAGADLLRGILAVQWLLLFLPVILFVVVGRFDLRKTLALGAPSKRHLAAGILLVLGGIPVSLLLAWLQLFIFPLPEEFLQAFAPLTTGGSPGQLARLLVVAALTPAICEELLFRGVLLSGSRGHHGATRALLLNAVVFGAFHLSYETAIRFVPTAWLGFLLALVVWRSGSVWVAVVMHFLNNAILVLLATSPAARELVGLDGLAPSPAMVVAAVALLTLGGWLLLAPGGSGADAAGRSAAAQPAPRARPAAGEAPDPSPG